MNHLSPSQVQAELQMFGDKIPRVYKKESR